MGRLKILAGGKSPQAQAQARGKLFEKLMAQVLRHYGYIIDRTPSVNYAGMEIDIEGKANITGIPLYAECKCYETEIVSSKLQAFYGKYMAMWLKDKRCQGLFIALPGINSHAKAFYNDNCDRTSEITVRLLEEDQVLEAIFQTETVTRPDAISRAIEKQMGTPGDWVLLYTDRGFFWVQYVIPPSVVVTNSIALFDAVGKALSDRSIVDYLTNLYPELEDFDKIAIGVPTTMQQPSIPQEAEEIVEVRGSSECFEYQFPASPEYFVGRQPILEELDSFVAKIINRETSSRAILFEANSGWGKSSVVLATVARLKKMGHFAVAIDSRSASSSQFILRVAAYALSTCGDFDGLLINDNSTRAITGFEGAVKALLSVGQILEHNGKVLFVFLDQFENVFALPETLKLIRDLLLKLCDAQTNVVLGFSWKTDLVGLTSKFPYQLRDAISESSKRIPLGTFSEVETTALLDKLSEELRAPLRKDLRFFLSEFSQGYPWLLKKLCAHVKSQREAHVPQLDIAHSLLNIEELFKEDLRGLSPEEQDTLLQIAKAAPIRVSELSEELSPQIIQSLVNRRLVVSIGNKLDVYWDIFRDYLSSGSVPVQENYILRTAVGSVLKAIKLLASANGTLSTSLFQEEGGLSAKSFYNVAREMRLLGLAEVSAGKVILRADIAAEANDLEGALQAHLRKKLQRNRLVWQLMEILKARALLDVNEISDLLSKWCPYISASKQTWRAYARTFAGWMDAADLAIFDRTNGTVHDYKPGMNIRERHLRFAKRRGGVRVPCIQYTPIERAASRLVDAVQGDGRIDWTGFKRSTIRKALATLEDLRFIKRKTTSITVLPKAFEFVSSPERRAALFAEGALRMPSFETFVDILDTHKDTSCSVSQLGVELKRKLRADWKESTATSNAKIMLNWARHTNLAPGAFARTQGKGTGPKKTEENNQLTLLSSINEE